MNNAANTTEDEAIDVSNYSTSPHQNWKSANVYDKTLCKNNKPLTGFINKCIFLDPTYEMENIINKVLLPAYVCADDEYKESDQFQRVIKKAFKRLIDEPEKKYSHLSDVYDTLKLHVKRPAKKKVGFVTLSSTINPEICDRKRHGFEESNKVRPKKSRLEVIALDDEDEDVIAIDDEVSEVTNTDTTTDVQEEKIDDPVNVNPIEIQDSQEIKITDEIQTDVEANNIINDDIDILKEEQDKENLDNNDNNDSGNKLLVPLMEIAEHEKKPEDLSEAENNARIKQIEAEIAKAKNKIEELELAEVTDDSEVSPYIQCHKLEARVVKLYKELCNLIDVEPVKARRVRLQVFEGHPEGPVRRLERFLNKQVDEDGVAPFPDFNDVVRCVETANEKDGLGWSKAKVMREAQAIFIYCGRALQKRRQGREWRHLRARAPRGCFDDDPAERDAELRAKLEFSRQVAATKEAEIIERFSRMESMAVLKKAQPDNKTTTNTTDANTTNEMSMLTEPEENSFQEERNNNETYHENDAEVIVNIKQEPEDIPIKIQYKGDISLVIEISDTDSSGDEL